ncbi:MAG: glycosyltransferase family 2 protein [Candidatus Hydrogenedentes bacterium]|nr:glycosyltransferase family 2 protein [Candidatus Hydrogenedentota bacterium]
MPAVSILTPVCNRRDDLFALAAGLERQTFRDFEWVIVDDGSDPAVATFLCPQAYPFPVRILRHDTNLGIGAARNSAVAAAAAGLLIWLDSDSAACGADWLAGHVRAHEEGLPALGIARGEAFLLHSRVEPRNHGIAAATFRYSNWHTSCQDHAYRMTKHHAPTNNTSVPREVFERVGCFDPAFQVAEDIDWGLRALAAGVAMVYVPDLPVDHRDPATLGAVWRSYRKMGCFAARVRRKNPGSPYGWIYPKSVVGAALWAVPFALLFSAYTVKTWFHRDRRVVLYLPMLVLANLANSVGMIDAARWGEGNRTYGP